MIYSALFINEYKCGDYLTKERLQTMNASRMHLLFRMISGKTSIQVLQKFYKVRDCLRHKSYGVMTEFGFMGSDYPDHNFPPNPTRFCLRDAVNERIRLLKFGYLDTKIIGLSTGKVITGYESLTEYVRQITYR